MRRIQNGEEVDVNDVEVPNDRYKPFNVDMTKGIDGQIQEENSKFIQKAGAMFDLPSLNIPQLPQK